MPSPLPVREAEPSSEPTADLRALAFCWSNTAEFFLPMAEWMRAHHGLDCTVVTGFSCGKAIFTRHGFQAFTLQELFFASESRPCPEGMAGEMSRITEVDRARGSDGLPRYFGPQGQGDDAYYEWAAERVTAVYDFLIETVRPHLVFTWNGSLLIQRAPVELARRAGIPSWFMERWLLPDSLVIDPEGHNQDSYIAGHRWDAVGAPLPSPNEIQRARDYCAEVVRVRSTAMACGKDASVGALRRMLDIPDNNRIVLLALPFHGDLSIPHSCSAYDTIPDIIQDVDGATAMHEDVTLVLKPHPQDSVSVPEADLLCASHIRLHSGPNLPGLLDVADVVVTVNSAVGLEALMTHKPVVVLGHAIYGEKGFTWDVESRDVLPDRLEAALHAAESGEFNESEFLRFLVYLFKHCLFSLTDTDPWGSREDAARRMLEAADGVESSQPAIPAAALQADVAAKSKPARRRWARKLCWRAWQCARAGHLYESLRNLRRAAILSPRLLLGPRTWLVPVRALAGALRRRARVL